MRTTRPHTGNYPNILCPLKVAKPAAKVHNLQVRVWLNLNPSKKEKHRIWTLDRSTGKHMDFYRKFNYVLRSCHIEIYDECTGRYWDSISFIPHVRDLEWTQAQVPVFVKMRPLQACC